MKKQFVLMSALATLALGAVAQAGIIFEEKINLGSHTLSGNQSAFIEYDSSNNPNQIVGFSVTFDYVVAGQSWAADLRLTFHGIPGTNGTGDFSVGGFPAPLPNGIPWQFQGSSASSGTYSHNTSMFIWFKDPITKADLTGFTLLNTWGPSPAAQWNNVSLTLYKIPAPGAFALLGLAGLSAARRRRN